MLSETSRSYQIIHKMYFSVFSLIQQYTFTCRLALERDHSFASNICRVAETLHIKLHFNIMPWGKGEHQ